MEEEPSTEKKREMVKKIEELKALWIDISELCGEIDREDADYAIDEFADGYPFEASFDEYPAGIAEWIERLKGAISNSEDGVGM